jgi:hypothetical protein
MRFNSCAKLLLAALLILAGCSSSDLRGKSEASPDSLTYLVVMDDNGGACGEILVNGKKWPTEIGVAGKISPGTHTIECGGKIEFSIEKGTTFLL